MLSVGALCKKEYKHHCKIHADETLLETKKQCYFG